MNIGTRWPFGGEAPSNLPPEFVATTREIEQTVVDAGTDPAGWSWTLTWLEGLPNAELDDGTVVTLDTDGSTCLVRRNALASAEFAGVEDPDADDLFPDR